VLNEDDQAVFVVHEFAIRKRVLVRNPMIVSTIVAALTPVILFLT